MDYQTLDNARSQRWARLQNGGRQILWTGLFWGILLDAQASIAAPPPADRPVVFQPQRLFVDPSLGSDRASGTERAPLKTITQALKRATANTVILLAPGIYSEATQEVFPLSLKPRVTLKGNSRDPQQPVILRGGGFFLSRTFARQHVTILGADEAGLTGVTITNPHPQGYGLWVESSSPVVIGNRFVGSGHDGLSIVGRSAPVVQRNHFYQNGANGITIYGVSRPDIQDNLVEDTGFGINVAQNAQPRLLGNRIRRNKDGIVVQGKAQPLIRHNWIEDNDRDGIVTIGQSQADVGTAADPGRNVFHNNRQWDINARNTSGVLPAFGNQLTLRKTQGKLDVSGTLSGVLPGLSDRFSPASRPSLLPSPPLQSFPAPPPLLPVRSPQSLQLTPAEQPDRESDRKPADLLPVPNPAPIGNVGQGRSGLYLGVLHPPKSVPRLTSTESVAFQYRVLVAVNSEGEQAQLKTLVPDAFPVMVQGRSYRQVGAFRSRAQADEQVQQLATQGFHSAIVPF